MKSKELERAAAESATLNKITVARKIAASYLPVKQQEMLFELLKLPSANKKGGKVKAKKMMGGGKAMPKKKMMYGSKVKKRK